VTSAEKIRINKENFMLNNHEIEDFRRRVETELATIHATLAGNAGGAVVELDQTSVGRLSRMDAMQQQAMTSGLQERLSLKKRRLEAALIRLDAGEFGLCCQCGDALSLERLEVDLGAPFCAVCQDEIDERRKSAERWTSA
jgi:DnaK suppressor protein